MTKDKRAKEMYAEYKKGFSLERVGRMFGITRQSVYSAFQRRSFVLRKMEPLPYQFFNGKKYTLRTSIGYYGQTIGKRELMHRAVWEFHNGKILKGYDIHHKDWNKANNKLENLELLRKDEHARKYQGGKNQYSKRSRVL